MQCYSTSYVVTNCMLLGEDRMITKRDENSPPASFLTSNSQPEWDNTDYSKDYTWLGVDRKEYMPLVWKPRDREILQHWIDVILDEASDELNDWESSFMDSIQIHLSNGSLTKDQEDKLEQIYVRYTS